MTKSICIISYSRIVADARVLRQVKYLSRNFSIQVIGHGKPHPDFPPSATLQWYEVPSKTRSLIGKTKMLIRMIRYLIGKVDRPQVLETAINCQADAYLANNWDALPIAAEAARINHAHLVLDIHESLNTTEGFLFNILNRLVVKRYAGQIEASTTVVKAIADDYRLAFGFEPDIVMNAPDLTYISPQSKRTDPQKIRLVHHGLAIPARHPDVMIRTLSLCDERYELHLIFINYASAYVTNLKKLADEIAPGRVVFHPPLPPLEIVQGISGFDIGFYPLPAKVYNHQIALPNKLFEFIAAGLAVCIGPSPSMAEVVNQYQCGVVANSFEPVDLAKILNQTTAVQWDEMRLSSLKAAQTLNADMEMGKLVGIFRELLKV